MWVSNLKLKPGIYEFKVGRPQTNLQHSPSSTALPAYLADRSAKAMQEPSVSGRAAGASASRMLQV